MNIVSFGRDSFKRGFFGFVFLLSLVAFASVAVAAEPPTVDTRINVYSDGAPTFNGNSYGPGGDGQYGTTPTDPLAVDNTDQGNDDSANNGIVRNSDNVIYKIQVNLNGADATNVTSTVTLSDGQIWNSMPSKCKDPGSSISVDKKTLNCLLGDFTQGTIVTFPAPAFVPMSTLNNTTLSASVSTTADGANTATDTSETVLSTASPRVNLVKSLINNGRAYDVLDPDSGELGKVITWGIGIYAEKGSEALDGSPISFTDTITYPTSTVTPKYKIYDWGSNPACGDNSYKTGLLPYGDSAIAAGSNTSNSVADSGSFACTQVGGEGTDLSISISGYDASGTSVPTKFSDNTSISLDQAYFVAGYVDIWIPYSDFHDPVNFNLGSYFLDVRNDYSIIDPTSTSGLSNYGAGTENIVDNGTNAGQTEDSTGGYDRQLSFDGDDGLMSKTGGVKSYPGGLVYPYITLNSGSAGTFEHCTKIDTSEITMTGNFLQGGSYDYFLRARQILDKSPFLSSFSLGPDGIANTADDGIQYDTIFSQAEPNSLGHDYSVNYTPGGGGFNFPAWQNVDDFNIRIEYSSVAVTDYQTDNCDDSVGTWVTDPTSDPGNFPNGWGSVTRMRLFIDYPGTDDPNTQNYNLQFFPEFQINPALDPAAGLGYGNVSEPDAFVTLWSSSRWFENPDGSDWENSTLTTGLNNAFDGNFVDRVELVSAQLRTHKSVTSVDVGDPVVPGQVVGYSIQSTFAGGVTASSDIVLTDTLHSSLSYVAGSTVVIPGDGILVNGQDPSVNPNIEPIISGNQLIWNLSDVPVGAAIPEILYDAQVSSEATSGVFDNVVVISEDNPNPIDISSTETERTSAASVYLTTPGDFDVLKLLTDRTTDKVEIGDSLSFDLTYANTSSSQDIYNTQFIEVFPFNGDAPRDPISDFTDSSQLEFVSITGSLGGEQYEFTAQDPALISNDPCHISNTPSGDPLPVVCTEGFVDDSGSIVGSSTGSTQWFDCSGGFGTVTCPIAQTDVTAIRMSILEPSPGVPVLPAGAERQSFTLVLQPHDNLAGDVYTNNFGARISESDLVAVSNDVSLTVVDSTLGDRIWFDLNGDGIQDLTEPGIAGVTVYLYDSTGTNLLDTAVTDSNGYYQFDALHSGDYQVIVNDSTLPAGLSATFDQDGIGTAHLIAGSLGIDDLKSDWDFGYNSIGSISGHVWEDDNEDVVIDPSEFLFPNVPVTVTWYGADGEPGGGDDAVFTTATDANGYYEISGLPLGTYGVTVDYPDGYEPVSERDGSVDNNIVVTLTDVAPDSVDNDFGLIQVETPTTSTTGNGGTTSTTPGGGSAGVGGSGLPYTGSDIAIAVLSSLVLIGMGVVVYRRNKKTPALE